MAVREIAIQKKKIVSGILNKNSVHKQHTVFVRSGVRPDTTDLSVLACRAILYVRIAAVDIAGSCHPDGVFFAALLYFGIVS